MASSGRESDLEAAASRRSSSSEPQLVAEVHHFACVASPPFAIQLHVVGHGRPPVVLDVQVRAVGNDHHDDLVLVDLHGFLRRPPSPFSVGLLQLVLSNFLSFLLRCTRGWPTSADLHLLF